MEAAEELFIDFENLDQRKLVNLQAAWRGAVVRKWMRSLRGSFEQIYAEVENNHESDVQWRRHEPCYPQFLTARDLNIHKSHVPPENTERQTDTCICCSHCQTSTTKKSTFCDRRTDSNGDAILLPNPVSTCKPTDDQSSQTVTMTTGCVESSASNPVVSDCRAEEETLFPESKEKCENHLQDRFEAWFKAWII
ncbi:uncharacterized protein LOC121378124 [Gigantopelta aegis]|uniref:uncharacterized protein LOC121378124 n=1 Tax=Gigantopelta aegis TaxID=1735272 RepID=UPI001B88D3B8|nr:uncharacterized protein LOC121378124 [Gigantopelta aegis]